MDKVTPINASVDQDASTQKLSKVSPQKSAEKPVRRQQSMLQRVATLTRKTTGILRKSTLTKTVIQEKNFPLSYFYGILCAITLGTANTMSVEVVRIGVKGIPALCFGMLAPYIFYHLYSYIKWRYDGCKNDSYFAKENSMYYFECEIQDSDSSSDSEQSVVDIKDQSEDEHEGGEYAPQKTNTIEEDLQNNPQNKVVLKKRIQPAFELNKTNKELVFSYERFCGSFSRCFTQLFIQTAIIYSFIYAIEAKINPGIISSIFAINLVFTALYFQFVYGQKISGMDIIGTVLILACILMIGLGGGGSDEETAKFSAEQLAEQQHAKVLSIVFAIVAGFAISLNAVSVQQCLRCGCDISQASYDGNLMMFLILFPAFLKIWFSDDNPITYFELTLGTIQYLLVTLGVLFMSLGIQVGHAGPINALYGQCSSIQTIATAIMVSQIPTVLQISGLVTGMIGILVIVFQEEKKDEESEKAKAENEAEKIKSQDIEIFPVKVDQEQPNSPTKLLQNQEN